VTPNLLHPPTIASIDLDTIAAMTIRQTPIVTSIAQVAYLVSFSMRSNNPPIFAAFSQLHLLVLNLRRSAYMKPKLDKPKPYSKLARPVLPQIQLQPTSDACAKSWLSAINISTVPGVTQHVP
jgi:hypothetical protein